MKRFALAISFLTAVSLPAAGPAFADPKPQASPAMIAKKTGAGSGPQRKPIHFFFTRKGVHNYRSDTEKVPRKMMSKREQEAMRKARAGSGKRQLPVHFTRTSHRGWHFLVTSRVRGGDAR